MLTGFSKTLGHLWDIIRGPYQVARVPRTGTGLMYTICSENLIDGYQVKICSERILYRTHYTRWWIIDTLTTLYYVSGQLIKPAEITVTKKQLEPLLVKVPFFKLFCTCTDMHYYAINAYIDTVEFNLRSMGTIHA